MAKVRLSRKQREVLETSRIVDEQYTRYKRARDGGHSDFLKLAAKCNNFYIGNQWEEADTAKLDSQGRPYLTINMVLATVNAVLGEQTAKRVEFKYKPAQGGVEDTATALTKVVQSVKDANKYDYVESQVFQDGIIQHGRGFFDIRVSFNDHMMGDIVIKSTDSMNVVIDPDAKEYDPRTWSEMYETSWMSPDEIEELYGRDKAEQVRTLGINSTRYDPDSIIWEDEGFGDARSKETSSWEGSSQEDEKTIRRVRVLERQHIRREPCYRFVDPVTGDTKVVPPSWDQGRMAEFAQMHQLFITKSAEKKVRWTVTADSVLLHDDWSPYKTFTKIPYFSYFRRGKPFGLVSNLISPQEQLNKLSSQELHIVNTTANSGWVVEEGALTGMTTDDLRNQGAETGLVITVARGRKDGVEKIKPNSVPPGLEHLANKSASFLKEISGVNQSMLGQDSSEVSGVAIKQNQHAGQIQLQVPFDNLDFTRHLVSEKLLELVQQFYTEERVFSIVTEGLNFEDQADQEIIVNMQTATGEVINDLTIGKYSTVLAMFPARDSFNDSQFAEAINLRSIGIMIPDDRVIEYSHLARKDQLADEVRQISGRGELSEEQMAQMQFEQQVRQQLMMAEVAKAEAEVMKLEAGAMQLAAEASLSEGGAGSPEMQSRREALEVQLLMSREGLQLRRDLAQLSATARLDQTVMTTQGRIVTDTNAKREDRKTKLLIGAQTKPTPAKR